MRVNKHGSSIFGFATGGDDVFAVLERLVADIRARDVGLSRVDTLKAHRSTVEDADLAASVMDLQMAQSGYQAVLGATARLTMPSLVDFLR